ncbi:MAG: glycosyltransferase [Microcoleus sp. PH2017_22_RUC_O_B]|uniref:glycosyltransferase n=1 Tax=unclassified Microcoleus TaxID=2642155 RepID=UPI001DF47E4F|nr:MULTISPECIES: glycosyltransferase [unclassified Microcoleus]MCC3527836.1 glycosyltransferase [Microcoleus sp. PH2017_21_RUC_O_A]MCC3539908.1 glycosyltransferase [Microcoleus sp. PH2017_22_RUC_O_B]
MMKIAVILPVYNETNCIEQTFDRILEFSQKNYAYNFIIVNDGSTDNTLQIIENKLKAFPTHHIKLISYSNRQGKGYAVKKGCEDADADCICFMDGDLAYSLEHLEPLVEKLEKFDVVIGCRNLDRENFRNLTLLRKIAGKIFNFISRVILNLKYKDMQAGLKGFKKIPAQELFKRQTLTGFSFDAELLFLAKKKGYTIGEIPARVSQKHLYKLSQVNILKDSLKMLSCLFKIRFNDRAGYYE